MWGIHRGPVNSPHKWPITRKMSSFDDVIMHYNRVTRVFRHPVSLAIRLLVESFNRANNKCTINTLHYWWFVQGSTGGQWIPRIKAQWCGKIFQVMTSECQHVLYSTLLLLHEISYLHISVSLNWVLRTKISSMINVNDNYIMVQWRLDSLWHYAITWTNADMSPVRIWNWHI